jgi:hypothetical protein
MIGFARRHAGRTLQLTAALSGLATAPLAETEGTIIATYPQRNDNAAITIAITETISEQNRN